LNGSTELFEGELEDWLLKLFPLFRREEGEQKRYREEGAEERGHSGVASLWRIEPFDYLQRQDRTYDRREHGEEHAKRGQRGSFVVVER